MDRRKFLLGLGAAGAALYLPNRYYFFGGWTPKPDVPPLLAALRAQGLDATSQYIVSEVGHGVLAQKVVAGTWEFPATQQTISFSRQAYVAFMVEDILEQDQRVIDAYVNAASYCFDAYGRDEALKAARIERGLTRARARMLSAA